MNKTFWKNKRVLITGHTGFKGSWLSLWLSILGADVYGYALKPNTTPNLFNILNLEEKINHCVGDIRNLEDLKKRVLSVNPDIIIHMAAQPLVRYSYENPVETYATNVMGTVNLFEAVRSCENVKVVVNVTTDKCYENKEWVWGYREDEPMGGYDPYSNSKGCSELVTSAYRNSYFNIENFSSHNTAIASARAGNVIGGGDWSQDRLIPDVLKALINTEEVLIRNPNAIRPWQHVLEPLSGYLKLAEKLWDDPIKHSGGWNFGPLDHDVKPVSYLVEYLVQHWPTKSKWVSDNAAHPHEANLLKLDITKAKNILDWQPRWTIEDTLKSIIQWYTVYKNKGDLLEETVRQIHQYNKNISTVNEKEICYVS